MITNKRIGELEFIGGCLGIANFYRGELLRGLNSESMSHAMKVACEMLIQESDKYRRSQDAMEVNPVAVETLTERTIRIVEENS